jgi:hypothetical protein
VDFYLFGKVKRSLIKPEILEKIDLLEAVTEILNDISGAELGGVVRIFIARVEKKIAAEMDSLSK